jgi:hypothetical protein
MLADLSRYSANRPQNAALAARGRYRPMIRSLPVVASLLLTFSSAAEARPFDVRQFFAGRTEGHGQLSQLLSSSRTLTVQGHGRIGPGGTLILDQTVHGASKQPKQREWQIREISPGQFRGTLSDATGPVTGEIRGNELHLSFKMKGGLDAQQWLVMAEDGRSVQNHMIIKKFGFKVAALEEVIRKLD